MTRAVTLAFSLLLTLTAIPSSPPPAQAGSDRQELVSVTVGGHSGCAVSAEGDAACWGTVHGNLLVPPTGSFTTVSAAQYHACGLKSDRTLACWGSSSAGILRTPEGTYISVDVAGVDTSCAVATDGEVTCWNYYGTDPFIEPAPEGPFVAVTVGPDHACGIQGSGAIACWGNNFSGQAPDAVNGSFTRTSAGAAFTCAIDADAALSCWGRHFASYDYSGTFIDVSAGQDHVCAIRTDASVACWGSDLDGQTDAPAGSFTHVAAGHLYTCAARTDLQLVCWGATRSPYLVPVMGSGPVEPATLDREYAWRFYGIEQSPAQTFRLTAGSLPPGLSLRTDGWVTGIPSETGTWPATVHASNGIGPDYEQTFELVVQPIPVFRLSGADRYATSAAVSSATWAGRPIRAFIATGANFPDALAAAAAGGSDFASGPILLVKHDAIPASVASELTRLRPYRITVLGGTSVVSSDVEEALKSYASTGDVTRVAGPDRYATAAEVSRTFFPRGVKRAFIATGTDFPDALAGAAAAGAWSSPLLLVGRDAIPATVAAELQRLEPRRIYVLGGTSVVSQAVEDLLGAYSADVVRLAGSNRYATAEAVSKANFALGAKRVYLATGLGFPDALAAAAAAGIHDSPLLLVPATSIPPVVASELNRLKPDAGYVVGGTSVVSKSVEDALKHYVAR